MAQVGGPSEKLPYNIHESERDVTPPPPPTQKPRRFWEKLGIYNIAVLVLGTIAIAIALAFLFFIWGASTHARRRSFSQLWYDIVDEGWATRVVTLSSVLIRVATAAQLGVFAAILAALILERVGVSTENLPLVSMIRCLNSGPHSLVLSVANSFFTRALFPYSMLIVLAICNAFALQFTSTILLSDFGFTPVVMDYKSDPVSFGLNFSLTAGYRNTNPYGGLDYWKTGPYSYQRFAEYKEKSSEGSNYVDTGKTLRGFPPQQAGEQWALREYHGPMMVVDTRTVCVKPTVRRLTLSDSFGSINGTFDWNSTHPDIHSAAETQGIGSTINCTIPFSDYYMDYYWATSLCTIGSMQARLAGGITPDDDDVDLPTGHTTAFLMLNVTGSGDDWDASLPNGTTLQPAEATGPLWTRYAAGNISIDFSLCFFNPLPWTYEVTVTSDENGYDESFIYNATSGSYNTTNLQFMYGATEKSLGPEKRGQLQLTNKSNWTAARTDVMHNVTVESFIFETLERVNYESFYAPDESGTAFDGVGTTSMFSEAAPPQFSVHRSHAVIFQQILQATKNPALAFQTAYTILLQMAYYDFLYEYNVELMSKYKVSDRLDIPHKWEGIGVVLSLLGLHLALVVTALRMFFTQTEMSLLGNAWQAVSQVVSTDTADVLHNGATTTDREVKGSMKQSGAADSRIRIAKSLANGRTEATAVRQRHGATYSAPVGHV
jgi:hypothetical protein